MIILVIINGPTGIHIIHHIIHQQYHGNHAVLAVAVTPVTNAGLTLNHGGSSVLTVEGE